MFRSIAEAGFSGSVLRPQPFSDGLGQMTKMTAMPMFGENPL